MRNKYIKIKETKNYPIGGYSLRNCRVKSNTEQIINHMLKGKPEKQTQVKICNGTIVITKRVK